MHLHLPGKVVSAVRREKSRRKEVQKGSTNRPRTPVQRNAMHNVRVLEEIYRMIREALATAPYFFASTSAITALFMVNVFQPFESSPVSEARSEFRTLPALSMLRIENSALDVHHANLRLYGIGYVVSTSLRALSRNVATRGSFLASAIVSTAIADWQSILPRMLTIIQT